MPIPSEQNVQSGLRWSLVGASVGAAIQLVQAILFARMTDPVAVGTYAIAATILSFLAPLAEAGMGEAIVQSRQINPRQLATLAWVNGSIGVLIFLVLCAIDGNYTTDTSMAGMVPLMALSLLFTPVGAQYGGMLSRRMRFEQAARAEIFSSVLALLCTLLLLQFGYGAWAMAWAYLLRNLLGTVAAWYFGRHEADIPWLQPGPVADVWPLLRFGAFDLAGRFADIASNSLDKILLAVSLGAAPLGLYAQAYALFVIPTARLGTIVTKVAYPVFARMQDDRIALQAFFERTNRHLILLLFPVYLLMALFAEEITLVLFGWDWYEMVPVLQALAVAGLLRSMAAAVPNFLRATGRPDWYLLLMVVWTVGSNLVLGLMLLLYDDIGVLAWSRLLAKLCIEIPLIYWLIQHTAYTFLPTLYFALFVVRRLGVVTFVAWLATGVFWDLWMAVLVKVLVFGLGILWIIQGKLQSEYEEILKILFGKKD